MTDAEERLAAAKVRYEIECATGDELDLHFATERLIEAQAARIRQLEEENESLRADLFFSVSVL